MLLQKSHWPSSVCSLRADAYAPGTAHAHGDSVFTEAVMAAGDSLITEMLESYVDVNGQAETSYLGG